MEHSISAMEIVGQGIKGLQLPIDVGDSPTRLRSNTVKLHVSVLGVQVPL